MSIRDPGPVGVELHTRGFTVAAVRPDRSIAALPLDDRDGVFAHTGARPWKWSLGAASDLVAVGTAGQFFAGLEDVAGRGARVVVAIPAVWGERPRRSLFAALERTTLEPLRLVRESSALVVGASLADESLSGVCAVIDLGCHKLEMALVEVVAGALRVRARDSLEGVEAARAGYGELQPMIEALAHRLSGAAGLGPRDVERVLTTGERLALPSIAHGIESIWGVPPEVLAPGAIARGAARVGAGLVGALPAWILDDDLDEAPLALARPSPRRPDAGAPRDTPASVAPGPPSSTPARSPSAMPSTAPADGAVAAVPHAGSFTGLASLDAVRALDLVHASGAAGLARPPLLTLLNQFTFLRSATGTLSLRSRDDALALPIDRGGVCVSDAEHARALRVAEWPAGEFAWREEPLPSFVTKHRAGMTAFVVALLRVRLRGFDDGAFAAAYEAKMSLSPSVAPGRRARVERLALPESEHRAVDHVFDGSRGLRTMLGEGYIGRMTLYRLVLLLDAYRVLEWGAPTHSEVDDPVAAVRRTLAGMDGANHFVALGVHWSAGHDEIEGAWRRLHDDHAPGGRRSLHDPAAAAAIVARADAAWAVLRDDRARVKHRREAYPGMDEALLAPLVEGRARALEMRGEADAAAEMSRLQREFEELLPKPPKKR